MRAVLRAARERAGAEAAAKERRALAAALPTLVDPAPAAAVIARGLAAASAGASRSHALRRASTACGASQAPSLLRAPLCQGEGCTAAGPAAAR